MTGGGNEVEVGVRDLRDGLSQYLKKVEQGAEVIVTRRGTRIVRLTPVNGERPLDDLVRRGIVRMPKRPKTRPESLREAKASVSDLVKEQRR